MIFLTILNGFLVTVHLMKKIIANWHNTAVLIPVFNGARYLDELYRRLNQFCPSCNLILINDASTDSSEVLAEKLGFSVISFTQNRGKGAALQAGFKFAISKGFDFAFTIDCDLQHKPEDIPLFIEKQNLTKADLIIGMRDFDPDKMPFHRVMSNSITSKIVSMVSGKDILDSQSGFRLYNLNLLKTLSFKSERYQFETEVIIKLAKLKANIEFVPIPTIYNGQESHISNFRDIGNFIKIVIYEMIHKMELEDEDITDK